MSVHLKMSPAVGIVRTVGKPSVFGEAFPCSEWESAFCGDFHGGGGFHNASRDAFVFAKRGDDAQTESFKVLVILEAFSSIFDLLFQPDDVYEIIHERDLPRRPVNVRECGAVCPRTKKHNVGPPALLW